MFIQVRFADIDTSPSVADHARECIVRQLKGYDARVTRVEVHLHDDSSPRKERTNDKRCTMEARLAGRRPVAVSHRGPEFYQVVDESARKLGRSLERRLGRLQDRSL